MILMMIIIIDGNYDVMKEGGRSACGITVAVAVQLVVVVMAMLSVMVVVIVERN